MIFISAVKQNIWCDRGELGTMVVSGGTGGRRECRREILEEGKALETKGNGTVWQNRKLERGIFRKVEVKTT